MRLLHFNPLLLWALRDVIRRPLEAILIGAALAALILIVGTVLLLTQALSHTVTRILEQAPSLVVRRLNAGGWSPIPSPDAVEFARSVPGVILARARIWGTVSGPQGPLTIVGFDGTHAKSFGSLERLPLPGSGEAIVGPGVNLNASTGDEKNGFLSLQGHDDRMLKVIGRLNAKTSMVTHDLVLVNPDDARGLLGIPAGYASDLALDVFHEEEEEAILPDLVEAFPWPVHVTTRTETLGMYAAGLARRGSIAFVTVFPALLSLGLIVTFTVRERMGRRHEVGLLKSMGWTTGDIVRLQMFRALFIGLPAVALGMLGAYGLVFQPGAAWPGRLFFGWTNSSPKLYLDPAGAALVLIEIGALVFLPYLAATLWPSLKGAAADPQDLLEGEGF